MTIKLEQLAQKAGLPLDPSLELFAEEIIRATIHTMRVNTAKNKAIYTSYDLSLSESVLEGCERAILAQWDLKPVYTDKPKQGKLTTL